MYVTLTVPPLTFLWVHRTVRAWSQMHINQSVNQSISQSLQTFINSSYFLSQLPKCCGFVYVHVGFQVSPEKVIGHSEVRRRGWPGDVTKTWNKASRKHGCQTVHWFTSCECCDTAGWTRARRQRREHPFLQSSALCNIVLRLRSLCSCLYCMPGRPLRDAIFRKYNA